MITEQRSMDPGIGGCLPTRTLTLSTPGSASMRAATLAATVSMRLYCWSSTTSRMRTYQRAEYPGVKYRDSPWRSRAC